MRGRALGGPRSSVGLRDMTLEWISGRLAIVQLARLMRDYRWPDRVALERCLDLFVRAARLPDAQRLPFPG